MSNHKNYIAKQYEEVEQYIQEIIDRGVSPGLFCTELDEDFPTFQKAKCEKVISGDNNSYLVFGRDRPESLASGAGGQGLGQCGMIDLVVGRGAVYSAQQDKPLTSGDALGPSFATDAARVYITQKCLDIDKYLGFTNTKTSSHGKSAIAIKSDHTRIVGRESVRIYCATGAFTGNKETSCLGLQVEKPRIELIAGNENKLQPAVLGENLKQHLEKNQEIVRDILSSLVEVFKQLGQINSALGLTGAPNFVKNLMKCVEKVIDGVPDVISSHLEEVQALDKALLKGGRSITSNSVYIT